MVKRNRKQKRFEAEEDEDIDDQHSEVEEQPEVEERPPKRGKWINKRRVLIFASRGIGFRHRHLMNNLKALMPHSKPESKMEKKKAPLSVINEICEMKNCDKCIFFESKKRRDLYMWISSVPNGPSAKFLVENVHSMEELKMTGNCLKGSRPILSFDTQFESSPHLMVLKEVFTQVFGTPRNHPKSQPFIDHVMNFAILDNRIWFRNYQIEENGTSLVEIGPRFVLNLIKIFKGSFEGAVLYTNTSYITPNAHRRNIKLEAANQYKQRIKAKNLLIMRRPKETYKLDPLDDVFQTTKLDKANVVGKKKFLKKTV